MRNLFPWRLLRPGTPVNKPGHEWFNAVTRVLSTIKITFSGNADPSIQRPNTDGSGWEIRIPDPSIAGSRDFPYKLTYDTDEIRVRQGRYTRNGITLTLETDVDEDYKSITAPVGGGAFLADTDYYVYLQLERNVGAENPHLLPDTLGVYADTALPVDTDCVTGNKIWLIGFASTDSAGEITSVTQYWWGGDIDNIAIVPDSDLNPSVTPSISTIALQSTSTNEAGLFGSRSELLEDGSGWTATNGFCTLRKDLTGAGGLQWWALDSQLAGAQRSLEISDAIYSPSAGLATGAIQLYGINTDAVAANLFNVEVCIRDQKNGETSFVTFSESDIPATPIPPHDELVGVSDSTEHDDRINELIGDYPSWGGSTAETYFDGQYWQLGGDNLTCYGAIIGDELQGEVINLTNRALVSAHQETLDWDAGVQYDNSAFASIHWFDRQLKDGAEKVVMDWTAANWKLDFAANDAWSVAGLKVGSTTAASATGGAIYAPNGGIAGGEGCYFLKGEAAQAGYFTDGTLAYVSLMAPGIAIDAISATNYAASLAVGDKAARFGSALYEVEICTATKAIDVTSGDYCHAGAQGQTITNWTGGGIVTGTDIIEVDFDSLQEGDKILVRRTAP
jgi:hypothetical protein